jgi:uncharacterized OB-fold protein
VILEGSIRLPFTYAAGRVGSRFMMGLRDSEVILGARCEQCSLVVCPARSLCPACGSGMHDLIEVGPAGTVETWTAVPGKGVFGMIRLDGADTALVHMLLGPLDQWVPGSRVVARFAAARVGTISDIEGFEPERGAS